MKTTFFIILSASTLLHAQGPLTPPGVPAPTMKSLDQIESRTAIPKSPAVPVAGPHYTISQPGSYYLTGNIEVASGNGINITASNVTLDLNGFALTSQTASPAAGNGIDIAANLSSIEIKNGRITGGTVRTYTGPKLWNATFAGSGWTYGVAAIGAGNSGIILSHITVQGCSTDGIRLGGNAHVLDVITSNKNGGLGIFCIYSILSKVTASSNGGIGIQANWCAVDHAHASINGSVGIGAQDGFISHAEATINGNTGLNAFQGTITNSTANNNGNFGISASNGSVTNSRATDNFKSGIAVGVGVAAHCVASDNSTDPATVDKQIDVSAGGQRDACVPATE